MSASHVLIVDSDTQLRGAAVAALGRAGIEATEASDRAGALRALGGEDFDVVLVAKRLPDGDGLELLARILAARPSSPVIVITAYYSVQGAVEAMKAGAFDYLPKPLSADQLLLAVRKALETRSLRLEMGRLTDENISRYGPESIIGKSRVIRALREDVRRIARSQAETILLQGESGTGKDVVAKAIHYASPRAPRPFVAVTCSAIPDALLESELFGHERGAFTDARETKRGLIELAEGGTVFFDEIAELSLPLQAKLLRFLEDRTFKRLGGTKDITVDVRIIAATNVRLEEAVARGRFRGDLFFRLKIVPLTLPPLRERKDDIPLLARHFVDHFNKKFRKRFEGLSQDALDRLVAYPWPGNVRELKNAIERIMLLETGPIIEAGMFLLTDARPARVPPPAEQDLSLKRLELETLLRALERAKGNQSQAAELLGVSRDTVRYRMRQYGIRLETRAVVTREVAPERARAGDDRKPSSLP